MSVNKVHATGLDYKDMARAINELIDLACPSNSKVKTSTKEAQEKV